MARTWYRPSGPWLFAEAEIRFHREAAALIDALPADLRYRNSVTRLRSLIAEEARPR